MGIRFNRLVGGVFYATHSANFAYNALLSKPANTKMVFLSHKTGDSSAERVAEHIHRVHGVLVYMAEWDDHIDTDTSALPDYIMYQIRQSDGFLVNVISAISVSMWIGYEIGGAHALNKSRAKIMHTTVVLPSVVAALDSLDSDPALDNWIRTHVLR